MIYTITVNPMLDYVMRLKKVDADSVNHSNDCQFLAGGKGTNISQVLNQLNIDNTTWGFVDGFTGKELVRQSSISQLFIFLSNSDIPVKALIHKHLC